MYDIGFDKLTESQKRAVFHNQGPLLVLAGPGSGKTRVITYRIAALIKEGVRPHNICAITFTNKAAGEMRQRAAMLGFSGNAHISTFHSLCVRLLREFAVAAKIKSNFSVYDASDQSKCIKQAVKDCGLDTTNFSPAKMLDAISTLKNKLVDPDAFKLEAGEFFTKNLSRVYCKYESMLREANALDFDDLLMETAVLLRDNEEVRKRLNDRFKYLLVDEYQDTNHAQYQIAKLLACEHKNICVTGDPDQSIYRWRGADIRNILAFEKDWPEAKVVKLEENFRSTANILKAADTLISVNVSRKQKRLVPTIDAGNVVVIETADDEKNEAMLVAGQIASLNQKGVPLKSIAVFYRVNSMSRVLEEAFIKQRIAYQIVRGVEFYGRKEIKDLLAYLKVLVNPQDEIALLRIVNTPTRGIGATTLLKVKEFAQSKGISLYEGLKQVNQISELGNAPKAKIAVFIDMMENFRCDIDGPVAPLAEKVFADSGLEKMFKSVAGTADNNSLENVAELINAAAQYDRDNENPNLLEYIQQIALFSDADTYDTSADRVALMTMHAAKGLEFDNVFIIGLEDGLLPHERSLNGDEEEIEEERRLFFVGITRAKKNLQISYSQYRTIYGQLSRSIPSMFLYELGLGFGVGDITRSRLESDSRQGGQIYEYEAEYAHQPQKSQMPEFVKGQRVQHKKFGYGTVVGYTDIGANSTVEVKFNTGNTKTLMVQFANLLKV